MLPRLASILLPQPLEELGPQAHITWLGLVCLKRVEREKVIGIEDSKGPGLMAMVWGDGVLLNFVWFWVCFLSVLGCELRASCLLCRYSMI
jgi:hypothetical protein